MNHLYSSLTISIYFQLIVTIQCKSARVLNKGVSNHLKVTFIENVTFSGPNDAITKNGNKFELPISFKALSFTCQSNNPIEWIFHCPTIPGRSIRISKHRSENNGGFDFSSSLQIKFTESPSSDNLELVNLTCRNVNSDSEKSSIIFRVCAPNALCIEIGAAPADLNENCLETMRNTTPNQSDRCNNALTLSVDLIKGAYQCNSSTISQTEFKQAECNNLDYCASLSRQTKGKNYCVKFGNERLSNPKHFFKNKPVVVECRIFGDGVISIPIYIAPKPNTMVNASNNTLYSDLSEALKQRTIIQVFSPRYNWTFWDGEEVEFQCMATLSLFSSGFKWAFQDKMANPIRIQNMTDNREDSVSQEDLETHVYITRKKFILSTNVAEIICMGPVVNSKEWKNASHSLNVKISIAPKINRVLTTETEGNVTLMCNATGLPAPAFKWFFNNDTVENNAEIVTNVDAGWKVITIGNGHNATISRLSFPNVEMKGRRIECVATNFKGVGRHVFSSENDAPKKWQLILIIGTIVLICILVGIILFMYKRFKDKPNVRELTAIEIQEFLHGVKTADQFSGAMLMPYDPKYEISRGSIDIEETILGAGQFGIVIKGKLNGTSVAIKTLRSVTEIAYFKALLSELKILQYVGNHPHIVNLIGACTGNIRKMEVLLVLDYCSNGNMVKFLRSCRPTFIDELHRNEDSTTTPLYQNNCMRLLSTQDLIRMAYEIAEAMDFIANKNILHGDLAARNILITDNKTAKVCDFGLAKQLFEYSVYVQRLECPLPLRWMAIESLQDMEFSIESDVWSFGVTLWEIFTLAELPYPGVNWSFESWRLLKDGYRLEQPQYSNSFLYGIMLRCWNADPKQRPEFCDLAVSLKRELYSLR